MQRTLILGHHESVVLLIIATLKYNPRQIGPPADPEAQILPGVPM